MNKMSTKCICNKEKRTQRLSSHLLKEHRTSILTEYNIEEIKRSIKYDKGYVLLKLAHLTNKYEHEKFYVSFGFNSGWLSSDNAKKANDTITKDQLCKHISVCEKLVKEYETTNVITDNIKLPDEKLNDQLNVLQKKNKRLEKEIQQLKENQEELENDITEHHQCSTTFKKLLLKTFNIDKTQFDIFIHNYSHIHKNHIDDDTFDKILENFNINEKYENKDE